ncbi:Htr-like protein [Salinarchaeum sp. Harcht-Bsk1]|uniref:PAS domain S-box protein n=1 Tax=Salinarchaeum sp. Harcht-Bsk1 TaxID=1333523 RepID=UPI000342429F|nr:PAS domain S-box protein [Salinarchaeum sp. Harcht-Bsk1]AGN01224.1 Htr-like protein [Salinarchaeum sp. Harcht-Bsk1]
MARSISILHVEDDSSFASLAAEFLEREDDRFEVEPAASASEGLELLDAGDYDCVVSDYDMPGRNGIELLEAVREDYPSLPFVLFTGKGSEEVASEAISAGVSDYLQKGTGTERYELLANRIATHVERTRTQRDLERRESQLRTAQEMADLGRWHYDLVEDDLVWSDAVADIFDLPDDVSMTFESFLEYVHPDDRDHVLESWDRALKGDTYDIEHRILTGSGETRWVRERAEVDFDDDGEPVHALGVVQDVTDRKQREQRLREERDRREALFENPTDPVIEIEFDDRTPIIQDVNDTFETLFGHDREAVIGEPVSEAIVPPDSESQRHHDEITAQVLQGEPVVSEVRRQTHDGPRQFLLRVFPFEVSDTSTGTYAIYADLADRKQEQERLRRYQRAVEASGHSIYWTEPNGTITYVNPAFEEKTGYTAEEAIGQTPSILKSGEHDSEYYRDLWQTILSGDVWQSEIVNTTKSGERYVAHQTIAPVTNDGEIEHFVAVNADVTERKQYEQEIADLHRTATELVGADSRQAIYDRTIEAAEVLLDFGSAAIATEADGKLHVRSMSENVPLEERPSLPVEEGLAGKTYRTGESYLVDDAAVDETAAPQSEAIRAALSVPVGDYGVFQVTDDRPGAFDERDLELAQLLVLHTRTALRTLDRERELERRNDRLDQFARAVSHDVTNPLALATGRVELLQERYDDADLDDVQYALDRIRQLLDDLFVLSKTGEAVIDTEPVALSTVAETCFRTIRDTDATLDFDGSCEILADRTRLRQLLENLFHNAVEHGDGSARITVGVLDDRQGLYVADDGPGVPETDRDRIFEEGHSGSDGGTGLGLAIVREIAAAHGWEVTVCESADGGACFELTGVEFVD